MSKSILILEENSVIHSLIATALDVDGITLHHEFNPESYLTKAQALMPDLILLSNADQQKDYSICRSIRTGQGLSQIPVVLLVNSTEQVPSDTMAELNLGGIIRKPFESSDLQQQVSKHLNLTDLIGSAFEFQKTQSLNEEKNPLEGLQVVDEDLAGMLSDDAPPQLEAMEDFDAINFGDVAPEDLALSEIETNNLTENVSLLDEEGLAEALEPERAFETVYEEEFVPLPESRILPEGDEMPLPVPSEPLEVPVDKSGAPLETVDTASMENRGEEPIEELGPGDLLEEETPDDVGFTATGFDQSLETPVESDWEGEEFPLDAVEVELSDDDMDYQGLNADLTGGSEGEDAPPPLNMEEEGEEEIPMAVRRMMEQQPVLSMESDSDLDKDPIALATGEDDLNFMADELGSLDQIVLDNEPLLDSDEGFAEEEIPDFEEPLEEESFLEDAIPDVEEEEEEAFPSEEEPISATLDEEEPGDLFAGEESFSESELGDDELEMTAPDESVLPDATLLDYPPDEPDELDIDEPMFAEDEPFSETELGDDDLEMASLEEEPEEQVSFEDELPPLPEEPEEIKPALGEDELETELTPAEDFPEEPLFGDDLSQSDELEFEEATEENALSFEGDFLELSQDGISGEISEEETDSVPESNSLFSPDSASETVVEAESGPDELGLELDEVPPSDEEAIQTEDMFAEDLSSEMDFAEEEDAPHSEEEEEGGISKDVLEEIASDETLETGEAILVPDDEFSEPLTEESLGEEEIDENKILAALAADGGSGTDDYEEEFESATFEAETEAFDVEAISEANVVDLLEDSEDEMVLDQDEEAIMLSSLEEEESFEASFAQEPEVGVGEEDETEKIDREVAQAVEDYPEPLEPLDTHEFPLEEEEATELEGVEMEALEEESTLELSPESESDEMLLTPEDSTDEEAEEGMDMPFPDESESVFVENVLSSEEDPDFPVQESALEEMEDKVTETTEGDETLPAEVRPDFLADLESLKEEIKDHPVGETLSEALGGPEDEGMELMEPGIDEPPSEAPAMTMEDEPMKMPASFAEEAAADYLAEAQSQLGEESLVDEELKDRLEDVLDELISRSVRKAVAEEMPKLLERLKKEGLEG